MMNACDVEYSTVSLAKAFTAKMTTQPTTTFLAIELEILALAQNIVATKSSNSVNGTTPASLHSIR